MSKKPIAVLCSDIHLQERAPVARSAEPDWWEAMRRPISQLKRLAKKHGVPVVCAGDVFNHWRAPPELINFALTELPEMWAVPGQHDLPLHSLKDIGKSAFGTLVQVGKIKMLSSDPVELNGAWFWGFPWNAELGPIHASKDRRLQVAIIHAYVWQKDSTYPGAPEEKRVGCYREKLKGFDVAVFGDNHKGFCRHYDDFTVFNHGGFMRRKSDEMDAQPAFGLLMSDGTVDTVPQDVSEDKFIPREQAKFEESNEFQMKEFLKELGELGDTELDFVDAVKHYLTTYAISPGAKQIILEAIHA